MLNFFPCLWSIIGPESLRNHGLVKTLSGNGFNLKDYGDLKFEPSNKSKIQHPKVKNLGSFLSSVELLSKKVCNVANENDLCLTIGGDHSLGFGTVNGHARAVEMQNKKLGVLWIGMLNIRIILF